MKIVKLIFKNLGTRVWFIVTVSVMVIIFTATMIATQVPFLYGTLSAVLGEERQTIVGLDKLTEEERAALQYFKADYTSKEDVLEAANKLNEKIAEDGTILLKNDDNSLPLAKTAGISVFGKNSVNLVYGGSGSSTSTGGAASAGVTIYQSLASAGFTNVNPSLEDFYKNNDASGAVRATTPSIGNILGGYPIGETPQTSYTPTVKASYANNYNDAALVVFSRIGGEGYDLPRTMRQAYVPKLGKYSYIDELVWGDTAEKIPGARSMDDHYLQLDQNETDLLEEVCGAFDNVIVIINCSTPMELGFLDDPSHDAYHDEIKGALWIGNPGDSGLNALGRILSGEVNPSGRTVDTYARDFKQDPSWNNFGNNLTYKGNGYTKNGTQTQRYSVEYEEGIYVGYRYWETRAAYPDSGDSSDWYDENVVFPFGYGLSYDMNFSWTVQPVTGAGSTLAKNGEIEIKVNVKNNGAAAGKDVVQLYYSAPYTAGGIEKAHVVLGDFAKTELLGPGDDEDLTLKIKVEDMASYDFSDANENGFKGYEAEGGDYQIMISKNAHDWDSNVIEYTVPEAGFKYSTDSETGNEITNLFDDESNHFKNSTTGEYGFLSRSDWTGTWPTTPTAADLAVDQAFIDSLNYTVDDQASDPWYADETPEYGKKVKSSELIQLYQLREKDYGDDLWKDLLDQLTITEMVELIGQGNYNTKQIARIGKPRTTDPDGPAGFALFMGNPSVYDTCFYASECVIGATYNKALAFAMGEMIGNEGLIGNEKGDSRPYSGWYAPAVNIHRSQFAGRNWEYYSEDGTLSGIMAANVVAGAKSKGVYAYVKHFALNDQETCRDFEGILTWAGEQSMREIYFKPFEMAVKDGGATAMMSSFNRIGKVWAGGDYRLLTRLLRDEWGFRGMVVTDYNLSSDGYMSPDQMIRAGGDINLVQNGPPSSSSGALTATQVSCIRRATKNILYTVVNSNAMNGIGEGTSIKYSLPYWVIWLIVLNIALLVGFAVWGFFAMRNAIKKLKVQVS